MNYELKRLELAIMNLFMYLLVLIIGKSKVLFVLKECAVFEPKSGNSATKFVICIFNDFFKQVITHSQKLKLLCYKTSQT